MSSTLIFDGHLDLAMNAIEWNRDLTRPLSEIRQREMHMKDKRTGEMVPCVLVS
jgi:membrane dipeptidase